MFRLLTQEWSTTPLVMRSYGIVSCLIHFVYIDSASQRLATVLLMKCSGVVLIYV